MLRRRHLGRVPFAEANDFQRALLNAKDDYILLFEHPPTFTKGVRTEEKNILSDLTLTGAAVVDADRGGDVTYHAPGQVVAWPIVSVPDDPSSGKAHNAILEDAVIATVKSFDASGKLGLVAVSYTHLTLPTNREV